MEIMIPIKQVPETSNVKMDKDTGTMIREGVVSVINPLDLYAIETGIQLKEKFGGKVTVCTMGPQSAVKALKEAIAMGCDEGFLISDKKFAGADTWATSYTISEAIKKLGSYDLVIAGERATDGDTGQVGPGIAAWLGLPLATYVSKIDNVTDESIVVERLVEDGYQILQMPLPALLTVVKEISNPRLPTLRGKKKARACQLQVMSAADLQLNDACIGLKGSPTRVIKIGYPKVSRSGKIFKASGDAGLNEAVDALFQFLEEKELI
ncbi:MAG: electron transfer flavoprotein subunit beta/FixA family protein [Dethiobacter sp.]|nr:electron transfer flavoprotein subunit beta/FixA family protein [Dethiobacter sp.]MBS3982288.1 electron transfer flavoprotein subunit beta/FixA family protein [Dethiobacter sp.]MCL4462522.1 electron transfer flavoprotein subunit beta/FixA family protein [Bacillota bacterium]MCL5992830.1 electron transfer flavoprotein subunit beta/FixA family protein [Bacillota bacterium]